MPPADRRLRMGQHVLVLIDLVSSGAKIMLKNKFIEMSLSPSLSQSLSLSSTLYFSLFLSFTLFYCLSLSCLSLSNLFAPARRSSLSRAAV